MYYLFRIVVIGIKVSGDTRSFSIAAHSCLPFYFIFYFISLQQYGALSHKIFKEMGEVEDEKGREINTKNMLVTGWMSPTREHVTSEIIAEERQRGFQLASSSFVVDSNLEPFLELVCRWKMQIYSIHFTMIVSCTDLGRNRFGESLFSAKSACCSNLWKQGPHQ